MARTLPGPLKTSRPLILFAVPATFGNFWKRGPSHFFGWQVAQQDAERQKFIVEKAAVFVAAFHLLDGLVLFWSTAKAEQERQATAGRLTKHFASDHSILRPSRGHSIRGGSRSSQDDL